MGTACYFAEERRSGPEEGHRRRRLGVPALKGKWDVAVEPDEVVEVLEGEGIALLAAGVGHEADDVMLAIW